MRYLMIGLVVTGLAACNKPEPPKTSVKPAVSSPAAVTYAALTVTPEKGKRSKPGCKLKSCPTLEVDLERLAGDKAVDSLIESELASLVTLGDKPVRYAGIDALATDFWAKSEQDWGIELQTKVLRQAGPLLVVQLDAYFFNGGAHGILQTRYLNIDRSQGNKILSLQEVLVAGQEGAFWNLARPIHDAWLKEMDATDAEFSESWPFVRTPNFALLDHGVMLKYQAYEQGPFAFGQPEFLVAREKAAPLLHPQFR